jgi:uncharacterized protein (DUF427 family)
VRYNGEWIADSDDVVLLYEAGSYPVAYFKRSSVRSGVLRPQDRMTTHPDFGGESWYSVSVGSRMTENAAWSFGSLPVHASILEDRLAFDWDAMDGFFEEEERIFGHASDPYHRIDLRDSNRRVVIGKDRDVVAESGRAIVLYESGFVARWYIPRDDVDQQALELEQAETFCPYKGRASYYSVRGASGAAWSYLEPLPEMTRIAGHVSFDMDALDVTIDGEPRSEAFL